MNRILVAALAALALAGATAAKAADMPLKAPPPSPAPVSWTGFYVGGFAGGAWDSPGASSTDAFTTGPAPGGGGLPIGTSGDGYNPWPYPFGNNGFGGATFGYNWQAVGVPIVFGGEIEAGYIKVSGAGPAVTSFSPSGVFGGSPCPNPPFTTACATSSATVGNWFVAETVRLGWLWTPSFLFYVKVGVAESRLSSSYNINCAPCGTLLAPAVFTNIAAASNIWGPVAGFGVEYLVSPRWSVKAEYEYFDFNGASVQPVGTIGCTACAGISGTPIRSTTSLISGIQTAKVGINYRFDWGSPVVARY